MITSKLKFVVSKVECVAARVVTYQRGSVFSCPPQQLRLLSSQSVLEMKKSGALKKPNSSKASAGRKKNDEAVALDEVISKLQNIHLSSHYVSPKKVKKCLKSGIRAFSTSSDNSGFQIKTLSDVAEYLSKPSTKKVVVMAGAGISTPSGIPDFRTPGSGLYDNLQKYKLPYPEAIFELDFFYMDPRPFFMLAKELYPGNYKPNLAHYFVRLLHKKEKLLRMYTQNIDGLERLAGIPPEKLVEAHGTFQTATCVKCGATYKGDDIKGEIFAGEIPYCKKKKSCGGVVKPDIVFFGEQLPDRFWMHAADMAAADLLIVMGTSLVVEPFASIAELVGRGTPRVLMNKATVGTFVYGERTNDVVEKGDVAECVKKFTNLLGWSTELEALCKENPRQ